MSEPTVDEIRARYPSTSVGRRLAHQAPHQMADDIRGLLVALEHSERALVTMREAFATSSTEEENRLRTRLAEAEHKLAIVLADMEPCVRRAEAQFQRAEAAEQRGRAAVEAIEYLFTPGPGIAVPELYPEQETYEPSKATWNKKLAKLRAALTPEGPVGPAAGGVRRGLG